jgi:phospho-N-acetylmuramoyl-pentapeptide-transferase
VIYELLYPLSKEFGWAGALNVLRYTPFRAIMSTITAMLLCFLVAPWFISQLRGKQISQIIREEGPESHFSKAGTPTMGGALILLAVLVPTMLWADVKNVFVICTAAVTAGYGAIGYLDDRLKIEGSNTRGLRGRYKLLLQFGIGAIVLYYLFLNTRGLPESWLTMRDRLAIPFVAFDKHPVSLPLWLYFAFVLVLVVGMSNAVNLTDGLDGLAIGPVMVNSGTYLLWAYVAGSVLFGRPLAEYLDIAGIPEMSELAVYTAAVIGAGIGFLWYNTYPAQVFMGDVGSLSLGGGLGKPADRRGIRAGGGQRDHPGAFVQAVRPSRLPDGAHPSPFREEGLAGTSHHRPFLDHFDPTGAGESVVFEVEVDPSGCSSQANRWLWSDWGAVASRQRVFVVPGAPACWPRTAGPQSSCPKRLGAWTPSCMQADTGTCPSSRWIWSWCRPECRRCRSWTGRRVPEQK